ncbi:hypothetical protein TrST_g2604 [Triparma strigata]|uniref:Uncharacterized protein n=1 Tax=Triparma strigata TaxID=1606541 RepID=A0A9W7AEE3_9STRA|nr:hypothetical protein TrST_g2604 [Triparma strigata]
MIPHILISVLALTIANTASGDDCSTEVYYQGLEDVLEAPESFSAEEIDARLRAVISPHTVIPYTSTNVDCWDALNVLDADPSDPDSVMLIYRQTPDLIANSGLSTGWNREHVWPKSYGVGYTGPDTSDLLSLRAADWSVNSARNNRYYDNCFDESVCDIPAHDEAPMDTGKMSIPGTTGIFMPPAAVRGDLARSLFYMATRYDGSESNTEDLKLSNCVCDTSHTMGKLSTLLQWHTEDPVDDAERVRNGLVCTDYQHNRNPYIDFPELVELVFINDDGENCPVCEEKASDEDDDEEEGEFFAVSKNHFAPGDVAVIGYNSDDVKSVQLLVLVDLEAGGTIFVTDEAWMGEGVGFSRNAEGVLKFTASVFVEAGTVVTWIEGEEGGGGGGVGTWTDNGSFLLSASGDQLLVYSLGAGEGEGDFQYEFAFGLQYRSSGWDTEISGTGSNDKGMLPEALAGGNFNLAVSHKDNKRWLGGDEERWAGLTKEGFLALICDGVNWDGDNSVSFDFSVMVGGGKFCVCEEEGQSCSAVEGDAVERRRLFGMMLEKEEEEDAHVHKQCHD